MIYVRKADERGHTKISWLDSKHSFSFGGYRDPNFMGFGPLRVINDDRVAPGAGFGAHPHANMEIISLVLEGALEHRDSLGTGSVIRPGDLQRMSAGTGIEHSEFNPSQDEPVHFLQIWIMPEAQGIVPSYEQKSFPAAQRQGQLKLVGSRTGRDGSLTIHQDLDLYLGNASAGQGISHPLSQQRMAWVQNLKGAIVLNGQALAEGDGAAIAEETALHISADKDAEFLVFEMPHRLS